MTTSSDSVVAYLLAKDGNRPYLMEKAFTKDASLEMIVNTGAISFPPISNGRDAISEVLVRRFGQIYENVYTLCLASPPEDQASAFTCDWLVVMTEKESRSVRVGCGRYDWQFSRESFLTERLLITIEAMQSLSADNQDCILRWVSDLPYPWCSVETALDNAPNLSDLNVVFEYMRSRHIADPTG